MFIDQQGQIRRLAGAQAHILAHTYVREDRWELFGFTEAPERDMFQLLIGVSGIGPNSALMILSGMSVADLSRAILEERVADLTRVRGVGPKTAQRVVVELKDRVRLPADGSADRSAGSDSDPVADEAMLALDALGFSGPAARKAVGAVRKKLGDGEVTVQALIKGALQER